MDKTSISALSSLIGVILGFVLGQFADWFKSSRLVKRQQKSIRQIIFLEIQKDYRLLSLFWEQIKNSAKIVNEMPADPAEHPIAHYVAKAPFPYLSTAVWDSNLTHISQVYNPEEIKKIWDFYEAVLQLDNLSKSIKHLRESAYLRGNTESGSLFPSGKIAASLEFSSDSEKPVELFVEIIEDILRNRSPNEIAKP
jgi:hypothetical protein